MRLLAGSLSFFPHGPLPHGNRLPPEQAIQEITRSCNVFYNLALEVTRHLFYISSQSHRPDIFSVGGNTRCVSMRWDHWGPCWSLLFSIVLIPLYTPYHLPSPDVCFWSPPHSRWMWFPKWLSGKESMCQCRRCKSLGFNLWVGKIHWSRNGNLLQSSCLKNPRQRSLVGYSPWDHKESDRTEHTGHTRWKFLDGSNFDLFCWMLYL